MGRALGTAVALAFAALTVALGAPGLAASADNTPAAGQQWPMFMGGFMHAGTSQAVGPSAPALKWALSLDPNHTDLGMSPVVGSGGTIYLIEIHTPNGSVPVARVLAVSPTTHSALWSWKADLVVGQPIPDFTTPAVAPDGTVYVVMPGAPQGQQLFAIANGGTTLWQDPSATFFGQHYLAGPPTIGPDGTVYLEDEDSVLYALNPENGDVYWSFAGSEGDETSATPALSSDGTTVYLPDGAGDLYALSSGPQGGQLRWTYHVHGPSGGAIASAPAVGPDGTIYVTTLGQNGATPADIEAISPEGTVLWSYTATSGFQTTPTVTAAGQVVAGDLAGTVVAVDQSDGSFAWSHSVASPSERWGGFYDSSAASDAKGDVYIQNPHGVFAFGPAGSLLWKLKHRIQWGASPALADSGTLYITGGWGGDCTCGPRPLLAYKTGG